MGSITSAYISSRRSPAIEKVEIPVDPRDKFKFVVKEISKEK